MRAVDRWIVGVAVSVVVAVSALFAGQEPAQSGDSRFEAVTVSTTPIGFSAGMLAWLSGRGPRTCRGVVVDADIVVRYDGTAPTADSGEPIPKGSRFLVTGYGAIVSFRAVRAADVNAGLRVHCSKLP